MATKIDPVHMRAAVMAVWEKGVSEASRSELADAVRSSARLLAQDAPGHSVEVRVPPFVAVQCIEGSRHTRGTPPNVVETTPEVWLRLVVGDLSLIDGVAQGLIDSSGAHADEVGKWLPLIGL